MISQAEEIRSRFSVFPFSDPCSESKIRDAEAALSEELPEVLRGLYFSFDGFRGPTNAQFFWPLFAAKPGSVGLVEMNLFFRGDELFPQSLVSQCVFFGDNGIGAQWGIAKNLSGKVIKYDAHWGSEFEIAGDTPLEAWLEEKRFYDELELAD